MNRAGFIEKLKRERELLRGIYLAMQELQPAQKNLILDYEWRAGTIHLHGKLIAQIATWIKRDKKQEAIDSIKNCLERIKTEVIGKFFNVIKKEVQDEQVLVAKTKNMREWKKQLKQEQLIEFTDYENFINKYSYYIKKLQVQRSKEAEKTIDTAKDKLKHANRKLRKIRKLMKKEQTLENADEHLLNLITQHQAIINEQRNLLIRETEEINQFEAELAKGDMQYANEHKDNLLRIYESLKKQLKSENVNVIKPINKFFKSERTEYKLFKKFDKLDKITSDDLQTVLEMLTTPHEIIRLMAKLNDPEIHKKIDSHEYARAMAEGAANIAEEERKYFLMGQKDPLTQLSSRAMIREHLARELKRAARHNLHLCVGFMDADKFKGINDTFGHKVGDDILRFVAKMAEKNKRKEDLVGRYGGEEFIFVLIDADKKQGIKALERIRKEIEINGRAALEASVKKNAPNKEVNRKVTASFGVAEYPTDGYEMDDLIQKADVALYYAKEKKGRNKVVGYEGGMQK